MLTKSNILRLFILLPILFLGLFASAQDWKPIKFGEKYFFRQGNDVKGIRIDTVYPSGADTFYINYTVPTTSTDSNCRFYYYGFNPYGWSWGGYRIIYDTSGNIQFHNKDSSWLYLKPQEALGTQWSFYNYPNGSYIEAEIEKLEEVNIDGIIDSAKIIELTFIDSLGVPQPSLYSYPKIWLGKRSGLLQFVDIENFPDTLDKVTRLNRDEITSFERVYDYQVGDKFVVKYNPAYWGGGIISKHCYEVLNRETTSLDLNITVKKSSWSYHYYYSPLFHDSTAHSLDTTILSFPSDDWRMNTMPNELGRHGYKSEFIQSHCKERLIHSYSRLAKCKVNTDSCISCGVDEYETNSYRDTLIEGIGHQYEYHCIFGGGPCAGMEQIAYSLKSSFECGDSTECDFKIENGDSSFLPKTSLRDIIVYPNPVYTNLYISIDTLRARELGIINAKISNMLGEVVYEIYELRYGVRKTNIAHLRNGIYLVSFYDARGKKLDNQVKIFIY